MSIINEAYLSISCIKAMASLDAEGMIEESGVAENWGNLKFILAASLKPEIVLNLYFSKIVKTRHEPQSFFDF